MSPRHPRTALLFSAVLSLGLLGSLAAAQTPQAQVYFQNDFNSGGSVSMSVDGQEAVNVSFAGSSTSFPFALTPGEHLFVVTRYAGTQWSEELASQTINVGSAGTYTLSFDDSTDDVGFANGYALSLTNGEPSEE